MPEYVYSAMDNAGRMHEGTFMAEDEIFIKQALRERGLMPIKISVKKNAAQKSLFGRRGPAADSLANFCRQLAMVIRAGMTMLRGLEVLQVQTGDAAMKAECTRMYREVLTGHSLSEAMAAEDSLMPGLLSRMVNTGEASGNLDVILRAMGDYYEQEYIVNKKIKGAMVYPTILILLSVGMIFFVFTFLIPQIQSLMAGTGADLPWITQMIINIGNGFRSHLVTIGIAAGGVIGGVMYYMSTPEGRYMKDRVAAKAPVFGEVVQSTVTARFARTAGIVFRGGIPLLQGLDLIKQNVGNAVAEKAIDNAIEGVRKGESLAANLESADFFDPMAIQLIRIGEETGNMEDLMDQMVAHYDREAQNGVAQILALIEPVMLLFMGVVIGGIVIASILPLFNLLGSIGPG